MKSPTKTYKSPNFSLFLLQHRLFQLKQTREERSSRGREKYSPGPEARERISSMPRKEAAHLDTNLFERDGTGNVRQILRTESSLRLCHARDAASRFYRSEHRGDLHGRISRMDLAMEQRRFRSRAPVVKCSATIIIIKIAGVELTVSRILLPHLLLA